MMRKMMLTVGLLVTGNVVAASVLAAGGLVLKPEQLAPQDRLARAPFAELDLFDPSERSAEALEQAATRINTLLDDVETPVRALSQQLTSLPPNALPSALASLNALSTNVTQVLAPLSSVAGLAGSLFGVKAAAPPPEPTPTPPPAAPSPPSPPRSCAPTRSPSPTAARPTRRSRRRWRRACTSCRKSLNKC